jgi:hypothetical protein
MAARARVDGARGPARGISGGGEAQSTAAWAGESTATGAPLPPARASASRAHRSPPLLPSSLRWRLTELAVQWGREPVTGDGSGAVVRRRRRGAGAPRRTVRGGAVGWDGARAPRRRASAGLLPPPCAPLVSPLRGGVGLGGRRARPPSSSLSPSWREGADEQPLREPHATSPMEEL